jgi:hypothetical protein
VGVAAVGVGVGVVAAGAGASAMASKGEGLESSSGVLESVGDSVDVAETLFDIVSFFFD